MARIFLLSFKYLLYNQFMGIYFYYGDEDYLIDFELKKQREKLDKNFSEMNYVVHKKLTYADFINVLRTPPMMFGKMMIVIECNELFPDKGTKRCDLLSYSFDDNQIEEITFALKNCPEMLDIYFVEKFPRNEKKKPDSRRKFVKLLLGFNKQEFKTIPTYDTASLSNWIIKLEKSKGVNLEKDAIDLLIKYKGNSLREYDMELEKLSLLAYPEKTVTKKMIEEMCTANQDLFNLTDYIVSNQKGKALLELRKLLKDVPFPMLVLSPLQTMLKKWIVIKLNSSSMTNKDLSIKLNMHEYVVQKTKEKLKKINLKDLVILRQNLTEAESRIKLGKTFSPAEELENAIIR